MTDKNETHVATVYTMEALVPGGSERCHAQMHVSLPAGTKLYTQPTTPAEPTKPLCRDCADFGPICPDTGKPCGFSADVAAAMQANTEAPSATRAGDVGDWLWGKLMDYCKARGITPASQDRLFALVDDARAKFPSTSEAPTEFPHEQMDAMATARYRVVESDNSMLWRHAVVAGDGKQQIYLGREAECQNMTRKFVGAFLDGAFAMYSILRGPGAAPTTQASETLTPPIAYSGRERGAWEHGLATGLAAPKQASVSDEQMRRIIDIAERATSYAVTGDKGYTKSRQDAADEIRAVLGLAASPSESMSQAARDVLAERQRQISKEGWTPEHDDAHGDGQLAVAAGYYALACGAPHDRDIGHGHMPKYWPWAPSWWKPRMARENLTRAGALILAEIERMDRAARTQGGSHAD